MIEELGLQSSNMSSSISRDIGENRRKSSGKYPSFEVLSEDDGEEDKASGQSESDDNWFRAGSAWWLLGGLPRKKGLESGRRRFTPFSRSNSYYDLVQSVLSADDPFDESSEDEDMFLIGTQD